MVIDTDICYTVYGYAGHSAQMRPMATDVAWSVCVGQMVTTMSFAKTAELIEISFGMWS